MIVLCLCAVNLLINTSILIVNVLMLLTMFWQLRKANRQIYLQTEQLKNLAEYNKAKEKLKSKINQYYKILETISIEKLGTLFSNNPQFEKSLENDIENIASRLIKLDIDKSIFEEIKKIIISRSNVNDDTKFIDYRNKIKINLEKL